MGEKIRYNDEGNWVTVYIKEKGKDNKEFILVKVYIIILKKSI